MGSRGPLSRLKIVPTVDADAVAESLADEVTPGAPEMPDGMPEAERNLWRAIVPQLDELGLVTTADGLTLDLMFRHYLAARIASEELAEADGVAIFDEKNGRQQKHPADAVFRLHSEMFLKYAQQQGMTFVSRARLAARGGAGDGEDNPFAPAQASGSS